MELEVELAVVEVLLEELLVDVLVRRCRNVVLDVLLVEVSLIVVLLEELLEVLLVEAELLVEVELVLRAVELVLRVVVRGVPVPPQTRSTSSSVASVVMVTIASLAQPEDEGVHGERSGSGELFCPARAGTRGGAARRGGGRMHALVQH